MSCQIYLISPPKITLETFVPLAREALRSGHVAVFQLRLKDCTDKDIIDASALLRPICHEFGIPFLLNDRADLVDIAKADGVHLGEEDDNYSKARALLGNKTIGVSCYDSIDRAMMFGEQGANYVSFGAFYPTTTKIPKANPKPELLTKWTTLSTLPCVAIGGINDNNCQSLAKAGADFIAVISYVWEHPEGPGVAIENLAKNGLN